MARKLAKYKPVVYDKLVIHFRMQDDCENFWKESYVTITPDTIDEKLDSMLDGDLLIDEKEYYYDIDADMIIYMDTVNSDGESNEDEIFWHSIPIGNNKKWYQENVNHWKDILHAIVNKDNKFELSLLTYPAKYDSKIWLDQNINIDELRHFAKTRQLNLATLEEQLHAGQEIVIENLVRDFTNKYDDQAESIRSALWEYVYYLQKMPITLSVMLKLATQKEKEKEKE